MLAAIPLPLDVAGDAADARDNEVPPPRRRSRTSARRCARNRARCRARARRRRFRSLEDVDQRAARRAGGDRARPCGRVRGGGGRGDRLERRGSVWRPKMAALRGASATDQRTGVARGDRRASRRGTSKACGARFLDAAKAHLEASLRRADLADASDGRATAQRVPAHGRTTRPGSAPPTVLGRRRRSPRPASRRWRRGRRYSPDEAQGDDPPARGRLDLLGRDRGRLRRAPRWRGRRPCSRGARRRAVIASRR